MKPTTDNPLYKYFVENNGRLIHKWLHYFDIYHRHFGPFRNKEVTIVEFGVAHGGSLQMWKSYFGKKARIIGIDIDEQAASLEEPQIEIMIGDQQDRDFLRKVAAKAGAIDVVIEDGGHSMKQQIHTFEELFPAVKEGGVYLVEDLHTSYWKEYGGGIKRKTTFIEYAKRLIDDVNAWHSRSGRKHPVTQYTKMIGGMHVYDSVMVFDRADLTPPTHEQRGKPTFDHVDFPPKAT